MPRLTQENIMLIKRSTTWNIKATELVNESKQLAFANNTKQNAN